MPGLVPGIHAFAHEERTWMTGTSSAKTRFALLPGHDREWIDAGRYVGQTLKRYSITISPVMPSSAWVLPSLVLISQRRSLARPAATGTSHHSADCPG
jgi:hypothetical protein